MRLEKMTVGHLSGWFGREKGFGGLRFAKDADGGGPGADIVYHLSQAHLCMGVPEKWALRRLIVDDESRTIAGIIGFRHGPASSWLEVGYSVSPIYAGQGVATKALADLIRESEAEDPELGFMARVHPSNMASIRVLEKNGFEFDGMTTAENMVTLARYRRYVKDPQ